jgi:molecular chaperone DnaK
LSKEQIEQMIREAEENAEADKQAKELIEARNSAEAQIYEVEKDLKDYGDKLTDEQKSELETVINAVKESLKGEDAQLIRDELNKVYPAMKALLDIKTSEEQAKAQAGTDSQPDENVVDATFTEKKDDKNV